MSTTPQTREHTDVRDEYVALATTLKEAARLIVAAQAARYDAPPGMVVTKGEVGSNVADITNPTLDTVLDQRRLDLSNEVREMEKFLHGTTHVLRSRLARLDRALSRWEGDAPKD